MFSDDELLDRLVLKGGNLLDIVYQISARSSVDVDFSMSGQFDNVENLKRRVERSLNSTFLAYGYVVFDFKLTEEPPKLSDDMKDFWGGYRVLFKIIDEAKHRSLRESIDDLRRFAAVVGENDSTVFRIDISKHEFCDDKQLFEVDNLSVYGYSPEMYAAEKLRAICQQMDEYVQFVRLHPRPRPKDFVDIQIISQHYGIDFAREDVRKIVCETFDAKKVPRKLLGRVGETRDFHEEGFDAVRATVYPHFDLQDFAFYFDFVCKKCTLLEPLWHV